MGFFQPNEVPHGNPDLRQAALHRRDSRGGAGRVGKNQAASEASRGAHDVYNSELIRLRSLSASAADAFQ